MAEERVRVEVTTEELQDLIIGVVHNRPLPAGARLALVRMRERIRQDVAAIHRRSGTVEIRPELP